MTSGFAECYDFSKRLFLSLSKSWSILLQNYLCITSVIEKKKNIFQFEVFLCKRENLFLALLTRSLKKLLHLTDKLASVALGPIMVEDN